MGHFGIVNIMNLSSYLDPVSITLLSRLDNPNLLGHNILIHTEEQLPDYYAAQICLVGLPEDAFVEQGFSDNGKLGASLVNSSFFMDEDPAESQIKIGSKSSNGADNIRAELYQLYKGQGNLVLADMGNLRPGPTAAQTAIRITQVCDMLHHAGAKVILIGPNQAATIQQVEGLCQYRDKQEQPKALSLTVVDHQLDMDYRPSGQDEHNFLNSLFLAAEPILFDFALLGHQNYLSDASQLAFLDQASFVSRRLGQHRDNPQMSELYMRQADCISMDLGSINGHEMRAVRDPKPFGLKGEEWCQLCWYAGHSTKLRSVGIYGYLPDEDRNGMAAKLVAVGLWHLLEGMAHSAHSQPITQYRVASPGLEDVVFVNQSSENRWWVTQQRNNIKSLDDDALLFACDASVYQEVLAGEVPQTLVRMMNRLSLHDKQVRKAKKARSRTKGKPISPSE